MATKFFVYRALKDSLAAAGEWPGTVSIDTGCVFQLYSFCATFMDSSLNDLSGWLDFQLGDTHENIFSDSVRLNMLINSSRDPFVLAQPRDFKGGDVIKMTIKNNHASTTGYFKIAFFGIKIIG